MANSVVIPVIIDDKGTATLGKLSTGFDQVGAKAKQAKTDFGSMFAGFAAAGASALGVMVAFNKALTAQAEQEAAINSLNLALANQGKFTAETSKALLDYAGTLQDTTVYADEVIAQNEAMAASFGMNEQQIKATIQAAADFAAATGKDIGSTVEMLGKAFAGNTAGLAKYGIVIDESVPKAERFQAALDQLNSRFGGAAQAEVMTYSGQLQQLKNQFGEVEEAVGKFLGQLLDLGGGSGAVIGALKGITDFIGHDLIIALGEARAQFAELFAGAIEDASRAINAFANISAKFGFQDDADFWHKQAGDLEGYAAALQGSADSYREQSNAAAESAGTVQTYTNNLHPAKIGTDALANSVKTLGQSWENAQRSAAGKFSSLSGSGQFNPIDTIDTAPAASKITKLIPGQQQMLTLTAGTAKATFDWAHALQGVALLAGTIGGKFESVVGVIANISKSFKDAKTSADKFYAVAAAAGQIGGIIGGRAGGALQGAAGGAMTGAALGSIIPGVGTVIGGVVGGLIGGLKGLFGGSKKAAEEAAAELARVKQAAMDAADTLVKMGKKLAEMRRAFLDKAVSSLPDLFKNFAKQADHSQAALDRLSRLGAANFAALRAAGLSVVDAMKQMAPALEAAAAAARATGNVLTGPMAGLADFASKVAKNEELVNAVSALNDQIAAMRALGMLTQDMANDVMGQMAEQMAQLTSAGFTASQSLALMAPALFQLQQAQQAGTISVDATTQALIDQAAASGLFDGMTDPMAELVELQKAMLELWIEIAKVLGAAVPAAASRAAAAIGNIPAPPGTGAGGPPGPGENGPKDPRREFAGGGVMRETGLAMLHGSPSAPEYIFTSEQMRRVSQRGGGGNGGITISLGGIHGVAGTPQAIGEAVTQAIERGTVPRLRTALREANQ